jgi:hypothetical protein
MRVPCKWVICGFVLAFTHAPAGAMTFTFDATFTPDIQIPFAPTVNQNPATTGNSIASGLETGLSHGDVIHGSFSYDPSATVVPHSQYFQGTSLRLELPSQTLATPSPLFLTFLPVSDGPTFSGFSPTASPLPGHPDLTYTFGIQLWGDEHHTIQPLPEQFVFSDDLALGKYYLAFAYINVVSDSGSSFYYFRIHQINAGDDAPGPLETPTPSALVLFASGLSGMGLFSLLRRRRNRKGGAGYSGNGSARLLFNASRLPATFTCPS